jgi:hypothetical protein
LKSLRTPAGNPMPLTIAQERVVVSILCDIQ